MNNLYVHHHLGLGDMIHMNGMMRRIIKEEKYDSIHVFSKNCHKTMVEWMYRDEPRIDVIDIDETGPEVELVNQVMREVEGEFVRIGHEHYRLQNNQNGPMTCDMIFYNQVGVPYSSRFDDCYWERDLKEEERVYNKLAPKGNDYIFVHDDPSRGFVINDESTNPNLEIVRNDMSESIFHLGMLLENAKEIHLMESSIRCMVEFLKPKLIENKVKLYFHNFRGGPFYNEETKSWNGTSLPFILVTK